MANFTPAPVSKSDSAIAFDTVAVHYDADATYIPLSYWLRGRVWERLAKLFRPGDHVLEIGCGTGEDALWLAKRSIYVTATDGSAAMLDVTRQKIEQAGLSEFVQYRQLDLEQAAQWQLPIAAYDGAFSNYGPLNCIGNWSALGAALADGVRLGGKIGLGVMGPICLTEIVWNTLRGRFRKATRRWQGHGMAFMGNGASFKVYYPLPQRLLHDFNSNTIGQKEAFIRCELTGLGVFIPPSELYISVGKHKRLTRLLMVMEMATASHWPFTHLGDHYWLELQRNSEVEVQG